MGIRAQTQLHTETAKNITPRQTGHRSNSRWPAQVRSGLCRYRPARAAALCCIVWFAVLRQPAQAQQIGIPFPFDGDDVDGSRLEFSTPEGMSCRFTDQERPSLSVGAGLAQPLVLNGINGFNSEVFSPTKTTGATPMAGVVLRLPLGGTGQKNCDQIMRREEAMMRVRNAQELFDLGLIEEDELKKVGANAYRTLMR